MDARRNLILRFAGLLVLASAISGCTHETQDGITTVIQWDWWVPLLVIVGGIACFFLGLFMSRLSSTLSSPGLCRLLARFGLAATFLGPIVCIFIVPALFNDKVTVNPDGFTARFGLWWSPSVYDARFADLSRIELLPKEKAGKTEYYLVCFRKEGGYEAIPDHGLIKRGGAAKIVETARQLGIPVEEHPVVEQATFAAIAYSRSTGTFGSSSDCRTLAEAERALPGAIARSLTLGSWSGCGTGWCALAVAEDKAFGYSRGRTSAEAERGALAHCREFTKTPCRIALSVFSGGTQAGSAPKEKQD